ncbi:MAG: choice-of-anchor J domain-containing protein [Reichenbachiella sp.]
MNRSFEDVSSMVKRDRPDLAWELDFLLTMNPATKKPEREKLLNIYNENRNHGNSLLSIPGENGAPWVERGPTNVGGRTRALTFDPNIENKVWAGSVSGGLWYISDITNPNALWQSVDDFWANLAITAIAFDPNNSDIIYVGTGEGWRNFDAVRGAGVWQSTDGGSSWNQLAATSNYRFIHDLVVRDESSGINPGVLYVANNDGMYRSQDSGDSFTEVYAQAPSDICIATDGRIWAGTTNGKIIYSDDGTTWLESQTTGMDRVAIACGPSNSDYVYALIEDAGVVGAIIYTNNSGTSWIPSNEPIDVDNGIPDDDFSRGQAWYDLVIAVDPNNENTVLVGAIDLFKSTDNGTNWEHIAKWSNNNNLFALPVSVVHADQHAISFKGNGSSEVIFGNDGGVFYSADLSNAASQDVIHSRNNNYNVTQFYSCALHPDLGKDNFLAGAQDNGTQRFDNSGLNATVEVFGGDGSFCFIDQTDPTYQIVSYVYNSFYLSTNEGLSFSSTLQRDQESGLFINPADYDDNQDILYSSKDENSINKITNISTSPSVESLTVSLGSTTSHLRVSPYTTNSTTLYAGTLGGRIFKIDNANTSSATATELTGSSFPVGSISCIEIGSNENELLVTYSNYGVSSIWYTNDGGANWEPKEGDLPNFPVRWALFNPNNRNEVILATELGIWKTSNISLSNPIWSSSNSGLANVRTDMLQIRNSDNEVIAATHGRGVFSSNGFQVEAEPRTDFVADATISCGSSITVNFSNLTSAHPTPSSYAWSFPGGEPSSSTNQTPPAITYNTVGQYDVSLTVTNDIGSTTETKSNYIRLGTGANLPFNEGFEGENFPPECWAISRGLNGLGTGSDWIKTTEDSNSGNSSAFVQYESTGSENSEDWLITPELDLTKTLQNTLTFSSRQNYPGEYNSQYHIRVSSTSQSELNSFSTIHTYLETDFSTSFTPFTLDLSAYDGQRIFLAFVLEQNDGDDWILDDVNISGIAPAITTDGSFTACEDDITTLTATAGTDFSYQWKIGGVNIERATNISIDAEESGEYSVEINLNDVTIESDPVNVLYLELPEITMQPFESNFCETESASFIVNAMGNDLSYEWYYDQNQISDNELFSGSLTPELIISNLDLTTEGEVFCSVFDLSGCFISTDTVSLNVFPLPTITNQPVGMEIETGENATFSVTAEGSNLEYQWYYNGSILEESMEAIGVSTSTLNIVSSIIENSGEYSCEITSICESILTSEIANLNVTGPTLIFEERINENLNIYPNPSFGDINISVEDILVGHPIQYHIYNLSGQLMTQNQIQLKPNDQSIQIDLSILNSGTYLMSLDFDGHKIHKQIIIK